MKADSAVDTLKCEFQLLQMCAPAQNQWTWNNNF